MILSRSEILAEIESGRVTIDPFDPRLVGAGSIDMRLSSHFRRLVSSQSPVDILPGLDYRDPENTTLVTVEEGDCLEIQPGETVLGITLERLDLPGNLCARLEGRSRFARLGLLIHISAGFLAPGTKNNTVLEISNMASRPLRLHPQVAICQCIFERMTSSAEHKGRYSRQGISDFLGQG